jgi:ABC-type multidrug transport system fused ATPase/permease subunit
MSAPPATVSKKPTTASASSSPTPAEDDDLLRDPWTPLRYLAKHVWPKDAPDLRRRVVLSLGLLVGAKLVNVLVPVFFKAAVDALTVAGPAAVTTAALAVPVAVLLGYGVARTTSSAFAELRSAIFSRVASAGIRAVARDTFAHLHAMDLKFHLNRNTGARTLCVCFWVAVVSSHMSGRDDLILTVSCVHVPSLSRLAPLIQFRARSTAARAASISS